MVIKSGFKGCFAATNVAHDLALIGFLFPLYLELVILAVVCASCVATLIAGC